MSHSLLTCNAELNTWRRSYGTHRPKTLDEWTSILHLATRWEFTDIRALAIRSIQSLDITPIDRIVLSREYDITGRWTLAAYTALCDRSEPLALSEANRLGLETSIRIAQMREQIRGPGRGGYRSLTRTAAARRATMPAVIRGGERPQWDVARSFLDQEKISPPAPRSNAPGSAARRSVTTPAKQPGLSRNAKLVAEAFGLEVGPV